MDYTTIIIIFALLIYVIGRRIVRGTKGVQYSVRSIFLTPIIYLILTAVLVIGLLSWQIAVLVVFIAAGLLLGKELGKRSDIFEKDGKILYTRSKEVLAIWIIAFVIRIAIDFTNPAFLGLITNSSSSSSGSIDLAMASTQTTPIVFIADLLLSCSAGLLFGEALVLYENFNTKYKKA